MKAVALANNSVGFIVWLPTGDGAKTETSKIDGCLGFHLERINVNTGTVKSLKSFVPFKGDKNSAWKPSTTDIWPVQGFKWKDFEAREGGTYKWRITPMGGVPGNLVPMSHLAQETNVVTLNSDCGDFVWACFNRGILATQALAHKLPKLADGSPDPDALIREIVKPDSEIRRMLAGSLPSFVQEFVQKARAEGGHCFEALYELSDPEIVDFYLQNTDFFSMVLANTGRDDLTNQAARKRLHEAGADVLDRMLPASAIGHNKSSVYVDKAGKARRFMSGSVNRTATGFCCQTNNALQVISDQLAQYGLEYWKLLEADTIDGAKQSAAFRQANAKRKANATLPDGTSLTVWFSPNTQRRSKPPKDAPTPPDMQEIFDCMDEARDALYFLAFYPGFPSIISKSEELRKQKPNLMIRGAVSSPQALPRTGRRGFVPKGAVQLVRPEGDSEIIVATALERVFGRWEKEILKLPDAHAIIHDKVMVINPMSDDAIVILGSHNLGFKASYANDENLLIIRGNRALAMAYMVHILDVYDHYNFRRIVGSGPQPRRGDVDPSHLNNLKRLVSENYYFDGFLEPSDRWQAAKLSGRSLKELSYWLSGPSTRLD